jgi:hypothetical protein
VVTVFAILALLYGNEGAYKLDEKYNFTVESANTVLININYFGDWGVCIY